MNQSKKPEVRDRVFNLYKNVKYLREKNGLSIKQLANIISIKEKHLALSEKCINFGYFSDDHIKKICTFFNVTPNTLFRKNLWEGTI